MNKVILMGRLTRDPETRHSQAAEPVAIVRFSIAVNRRFKRDNEPDADFFDCVAFGKTGEFVEKYFKKGQMIAVTGSLRNSSWEDRETGQKKFKTEIAVDEAYFAEGKKENGESASEAAASMKKAAAKKRDNEPQFQISADDDDLPFNTN